MRREFANICLNLVESDPQAVVLVGDISHYLLRDTQLAAPDRFFNIGICEQSMVSLASGMAIEGLKPVLHTIAPFLVERAYEQIKVDVGYQDLNVTFVSVGGTYDYSDLGCTHHCYGDIALMRTIPNMQIFEPGNKKEFRQLFDATWNTNSPKYFRLSSKTHSLDLDVEPGEINVVRESKNGNYVFVCGHFLEDVMCDEKVGVFYVPTLSHISEASIQKANILIKDSNQIFTVENHFKIGGLGDIISETFDKKVKRIGLERKFITSYGSYEELRHSAGLSRDQILERINE